MIHAPLLPLGPTHDPHALLQPQVCGLEDYKAALPLSERAVIIYLKCSGPDSVDTADAKNNLGVNL